MSYLVETYRLASGGAATTRAMEETIGRVVAGLREEGCDIEFVASMSIPGDEVTFYLFESGSRDVVEEAIRRAGMDAERVVEAVASELKSRWPAVAGGSPGGH